MMNYKTIGAEALLSKATSTKSVFLCGNGFSINFDDNYKSDNLANRLFETHCHLKKYSDFDVISNGIYKTIFTENFKAAKKFSDLSKHGMRLIFSFKMLMILRIQ